MPLVAFSVRLDRVEEALLYQDKAGNYWLSGVCVFETDTKGRTLVVQSIPPERYKAGERGLQLGHWREIGASKPGQPGRPVKPAVDLSKYKKPSVPDQATSTTRGELVSNGSLSPDEEGGVV